MAGAGVFRPLVRLLGLVGVPGEGLDAGLTPVFFMTDVRLLRMELIFARSTLARFGKANAGVGERREAFTGFGRGGVAAMVTGAGVHEEALEILSVGFVGTAVDTFRFSSYQTVGFSVTEKALRWEGHPSQTNFVLPPTPSSLVGRVMTCPPDIPLGTGMWVPLTVRRLGEPKALASRLSIWGRDSR